MYLTSPVEVPYLLQQLPALKGFLVRELIKI